MAEVNRLLKQHRQMQDAFKSMAKGGGRGFARMAQMFGAGTGAPGAMAGGPPPGVGGPALPGLAGLGGKGPALPGLGAPPAFNPFQALKKP
ncbi:MAG: hypothetical protein JOZ27_02085 [Caulobacteraceae bacterium]|nr:hypothetical protein [Caulobacteraceae bacterium]